MDTKTDPSNPTASEAAAINAQLCAAEDHIRRARALMTKAGVSATSLQRRALGELADVLRGMDARLFPVTK